LILWKIIQISKSGPYDYAKVPDHPKANKNGYVLLHRIIMENFLGRLLNDEEIVHHKDKDGHNNDIENLEVMDRKEHLTMHTRSRQTTKYYTFNCDWCGRKTTRKAKDVHPKNAKIFCSRRCCGYYYARTKFAKKNKKE
jgi:hypothetical protein